MCIARTSRRPFNCQKISKDCLRSLASLSSRRAPLSADGTNDASIRVRDCSSKEMPHLDSQVGGDIDGVIRSMAEDAAKHGGHVPFAGRKGGATRQAYVTFLDEVVSVMHAQVSVQHLPG